jgi:hypothetical protein
VSEIIIWVIIQRRKSWMGHAAHTVQEKKIYVVLAEEPEEKNYFEDLSTGMRITLTWVSKKYDSSGLRKGQLGGSCEHSKNILSPHNGRSFLTS